MNTSYLPVWVSLPRAWGLQETPFVCIIGRQETILFIILTGGGGLTTTWKGEEVVVAVVGEETGKTGPGTPGTEAAILAAVCNETGTGLLPTAPALAEFICTEGTVLTCETQYAITWVEYSYQ